MHGSMQDFGEKVLVCAGHYAPLLSSPSRVGGSPIASLHGGLDAILDLRDMGKEADLLILINDLHMGEDSAEVRENYYRDFKLPYELSKSILNAYKEQSFSTYVIGERKLANKLRGEIKRKRNVNLDLLVEDKKGVHVKVDGKKVPLIVNERDSKTTYHHQCIGAIARLYALATTELGYDSLLLILPTCSKPRSTIGLEVGRQLYGLEKPAMIGFRGHSCTYL